MARTPKSDQCAPGDAPAADFSATHPAETRTDADKAAALNDAAAADAGARAPATDAPPTEAVDAGAAQSGAALEPAAHVDIKLSAVVLCSMPALLRPAAMIVVKSRSPRRRRAGRAFTPVETVIPLAALTDDEALAIAHDVDLIAHLRLPAPLGL